MPLRQKFLPSEDEVTTTILSLLDPRSPGVSPTDLARVLGRCRLCGQYASRTALLGHQCGGRGDLADDPYDANAYYGVHSSPSGNKGKGSLMCPLTDGSLLMLPKSRTKRTASVFRPTDMTTGELPRQV